MAQIIPLLIVLDLGNGSEFFNSVADSDQDISYPWPGDPYTLDLTNPPELMQAVWIGVSQDGNTMQAFPVTTPIPTIIAAGFPRVYQGTEIADSEGNVMVFSNQYNHVLLAISACCTTQVLTQVLALKQSNYPLIVGQTYPCGAEAIFKWLAILGSNETTPDLVYSFRVSLENQDGDVLISEYFVLSEPLTETVQATKSWPSDFIGMTIGGTTLVANDATPGVGERRVSDFDNGTITLQVEITDGIDFGQSTSASFALPGTDCGSDSGDDSGIFGSEFGDSFA